MLMENLLKKDKYSRARGGNSIFYSLSCSSCEEFLLVYQKDGIGNMLRLYIDRISGSESLKKLQSIENKADLPILKCEKCGLVIGVPMIYAPEKRLAFRLVRGAFKKEYLA